MRGPILPQSRNSLELTYADRWAHADRFAARSPGAVAPCRRMLVASSTPLEPGPLAGAPHWGCRSSHSAPELTAARSCSRAHRRRPRSEQLPHVVRTGAATSCWSSPPLLPVTRAHGGASVQSLEVSQLPHDGTSDAPGADAARWSSPPLTAALVLSQPHVEIDREERKTKWLGRRLEKTSRR
jgi:hypothetical protein